MLWENRLSFHNLLSISGGKKVEKRWEIIEFYDSVAEGEAFCLYGIGNLTHVRSIDVRWKMEDVRGKKFNPSYFVHGEHLPL